MRIDIGRALRVLVLAVWAAFFVWLLISGEVNRYIGPRTQWVVVFGAVALTVATVAHLLRPVRRPRTTTRDALGLLAMLVPLIAVLAVPTPSLGSLAASRKITGTFTSGVLQPRASDVEDISFTEIEYASDSAAFAQNLGIADGLPIELTGFVNNNVELTDGDFRLTRFSIYCCAADVVPHSVTIEGEAGQSFEDDQWLTVTGTLAERDGEFVVVPEEIEEVDEPKNPYLS
ncbi:MAG: TIGR03943 family putative permease subunit [Actinomycetota bacterium]